jgi:hypothetical protein
MRGRTSKGLVNAFQEVQTVRYVRQPRPFESPARSFVGCESAVFSVMTIRIAALVLLGAMAAAAQTEVAPDTPVPKPVQVPPVMMKLLGDYGGWWRTLSDESRDNFVDGYTAAMQNVQVTMRNECMKNAKSVQPGPEFNAKLQDSLNLCVLSKEFDYKSDLSLRTGLDRFYKNPLNAAIPPEYALEYLRDELQHNKTVDQLRNELTEWRKAMPSPPPAH